MNRAEFENEQWLFEEAQVIIGEIPRAHARRSDPETSREAARSVTNIRESQQRILGVFQVGGPMADHQLLEYLPRTYSPSGVRTRRSELVAKGLLRDSGKRIKTPAGRNAIVWEAVS